MTTAAANVNLVSTAPGELGREAAAAIRDMSRRIANGRTSTMLLADDLGASWSALTAGGWDGVGVRDGDDGASLLDLVTIAMAWGETCLPLPLIPTILTKRWSDAAAEADGRPTTLAVPHRSRLGALVPFGAFPAIGLATELGPDSKGALAEVAVEPDDLGPTLGLGVAAQASTLSAEAAHEVSVVWGAEAVGAAGRMLAEGVEYAKLREQFGKPIGTFQAVKHKLAEAHIQLEFAETAVLWAATEPADGARALRFAFRACREVGEHSIQVHGGVGFTWELGLHFYLRHILALTELAGALSSGRPAP